MEAGQVCEDLVSTVDLGPAMLSLAGIDVPAHMQGRAFLGHQAQPPREYIYASRDRHDEAYDMVRAVRDRRFKYIRNYRPDLPYLAWIPYRNRHPIVQEMWRLHLADELDETQRAMFRYPEAGRRAVTTPRSTRTRSTTWRPISSISRSGIDCAEPWTNGYEKWATWAEWRKAKWCGSGIPMANSRRRPRRCACPFAPTAPGPSQRWKAVHSKGRCWVQLHCATQGASIAYAVDDQPHWHLYTEPLRMEVGTATLRAKAIRIGYEESQETRATFVVE